MKRLAESKSNKGAQEHAIWVFQETNTKRELGEQKVLGSNNCERKRKEAGLVKLRQT